MDNENLGNAFKKGGPFADNIRISTDSGDDDELRESLKTHGWIGEFPALSDEHGVILVGHRRLKIAKELGINPVIKKLELGDGREGDAQRLRLAIASNVGFKPMTKKDRQRIAEYLYGERDWTMQRIADALSVTKSAISKDLSGVVSSGNNPARPKGGRPKKPRKPPKRHAQADEVVNLAEEGLTDEEISNKTGVPARTVRREVEVEAIRREAKAEAEIDLATLSLSAQQKCEAWKRQTEKRLRAEIASEERMKIRQEWNEDYLPHYNKEMEHAKAIKKAWKGVFTATEYRRLLAAFHPDQSTSAEILHEAFILFKSKERILLSEKERPAVPSASPLPKTWEDWMEKKRKVSEERKAKRAANKAAASNTA